MLTVLAVAGLSVQAQVRDDASTSIQEDTLFYESFDNMAGKGGNDGDWSISYSLNVFQFSTAGTINEGWKNTGTDVRPASKCVVIGTNGNLVSPVLAKLKGAAVLTFRAGATIKSKTRLKVTVMNGGEIVGAGGNAVTVNLPNKEFGTFSFILKNCTAKTQLSFTNPDAFKALLLDDVTLTEMVSIDEAKNNLATMTRYNNKVVDVVLGRAMASGEWNSVCLPFALTPQQVAEVFGTGARLAQFESAPLGKKTLNFVLTDHIEAGKPYLVLPTQAVDNPIIQGVTMKLISNPIVVHGAYSFVGTTSPVSLLTKMVVVQADGTLAEVAKANNLYSLPGLRAYFALPSTTTPGDVTVMIGASTTTDIDSVTADEAPAVTAPLYNVGGQRVSTPVRGSVYIRNGKKYIAR
mgnify:FL=1